MAQLPNEITVRLDFDAEKYKAELLKATREAVCGALQQVVDRMDEFISISNRSDQGNACDGGTL
jgi:hypothetical protein